MAYSKRAITWARRKTPVKCSCGCEVIIIPKPAWYARRNKPPEVRYIRGHSTREINANPSQARERAEMKERPDTLILIDKSLDAVTVECPNPECGTRWQVSATVADIITNGGCSFCGMDDIIADRIRQGIPVWPEDDLDESEGAIAMNVPTYQFLKEECPHMSLGELAQHVKNGTLPQLRDQRIAAEVRDILDQCGLSEEYLV